MVVKRRMKILIVTAVLLLTVALLLPVLRAMALHRPASYNPPTLSIQEQEQAEAKGWQKSQEFYNSVQRENTFSITIEESLVNDLLVHNDAVSFAERFGVKNGQAGPVQVVFSKGIVGIIIPVSRDDTTIYVTMRLKPSIIGQKKMLSMELLPLKVGSLFVPNVLASEHIDRIRNAIARAGDRVSSGQNTKNQSQRKLGIVVRDEVIPKLLELLKEKHVIILPEFRGDTDRLARIVGLEISQGLLQLEIKPVSPISPLRKD